MCTFWTIILHPNFINFHYYCKYIVIYIQCHLVVISLTNNIYLYIYVCVWIHNSEWIYKVLSGLGVGRIYPDSNGFRINRSKNLDPHWVYVTGLGQCLKNRGRVWSMKNPPQPTSLPSPNETYKQNIKYKKGKKREKSKKRHLHNPTQYVLTAGSHCVYITVEINGIFNGWNMLCHQFVFHQTSPYDNGYLEEMT